MAPDVDGDLGCDVLIIGAGIQGLYLANALVRDGYVVCLVTDPNSPLETTDADGYFSAGYDGNDVARIQPARRAAGFWRLWAESHQVTVDPQPPLAAVPVGEVPTRTRLWLDATLNMAETSAPDILAGGTLRGQQFYTLANDVVLSPTQVLARLRDGLAERHMWGEVVQFGLVGDTAIDYVNVDIGDRNIVPIVPRYTVLAANAGNAALLNLLASRFRDQHRRLEAKEAVKNSQAVRRELRVLVRGNLPALDGQFGSLTIASHAMGTPGDRVWVVSVPAADDQTVMGIDDIRFEPQARPGAVAAVVAELFAMAPDLRAEAASVTWASFVARHSQHPMAASSGPEIGRPVPAKIETLGLEGFLALWPSHLSYAMVLGDVAHERITTALGSPGSYTEGPQPFHFPEPSPESLIARWDQDGFAWLPWGEFAPLHGIA
jgi:glycine/D-amino acid oxidase-like deaminating enzyme